MDSNLRSPVKDQLVETVLFDFPAEARKRTIGGRRSQPRDLGGDLRRDHNLRDDNDRLGWGRRQAQNGGSPDGGPMVRIMLPPAASPFLSRPPSKVENRGFPRGCAPVQSWAIAAGFPGRRIRKLDPGPAEAHLDGKVGGMTPAALRHFKPGTGVSIIEGERLAVPHDLLAADEHVLYRPLAGGIDETADRIVSLPSCKNWVAEKKGHLAARAGPFVESQASPSLCERRRLPCQNISEH